LTETTQKTKNEIRHSSR